MSTSRRHSTSRIDLHPAGPPPPRVRLRNGTVAVRRGDVYVVPGTSSPAESSAHGQPIVNEAVDPPSSPTEIIDSWGD